MGIIQCTRRVHQSPTVVKGKTIIKILFFDSDFLRYTESSKRSLITVPILDRKDWSSVTTTCKGCLFYHKHSVLT